MKPIILAVLLFSSTVLAADPTPAQVACLASLCATPVTSTAKEARLGTCFFDSQKKILISSSGVPGAEYYAANEQGVFPVFVQKLQPKTLEVAFSNRQSVAFARVGIRFHQFTEYFMGDLSAGGAGEHKTFPVKERSRITDRKTLSEEAGLVSWTQINELFRDFTSTIDFKFETLTAQEYKTIRDQFVSKAQACQAAAEKDPKLKEALGLFFRKMNSLTFAPAAGQATPQEKKSAPAS